MLEISIVQGEVSGGNRIILNENRLILRLHFYDKEFLQKSISISQEYERITIKSSEYVIKKIKNLLTRRDSLGQITWCIIQNEYRTLEKLEEKVEKLQNASIHEYSSALQRNILQIKKNLFYMHRDYLRLRNIIEGAIDKKYEIDEMHRILRDVNEMIEIVEYLVDAATTAIQLMQNTLTAKMNDVMKILTVIATIMMPLTLIAGIYGMNFKNMPELYWEYGYYYALALMLVIAVIMIYYFKIKRII